MKYATAYQRNTYTQKVLVDNMILCDMMAVLKRSYVKKGLKR